jgi:hypothetical protein
MSRQPLREHPRPIARIEGRKILTAISDVVIESESGTDCSHLVHDIYEQAGFPYTYVSSRELYIGSTNFTRVRVSQAGRLARPWPAVCIKDNRGSAIVRIESLAAPGETQTGAPFRCREESLKFKKTNRGWMMRPLKDAAYVNDEVALRVLSVRLADLAENTDATPQQKRKQAQITRFLNRLVIDNSTLVDTQLP